MEVLEYLTDLSELVHSWYPVVQFTVWLSYSYLDVTNALLLQWLRRSKGFGFDTSSSASTVLIKLRSWQRESKMRGRMTFIRWNKPETLSVGERCFHFHVKADKGGFSSQSHASFQSFVFTFVCHKWYHSALWNVGIYSRSLVFVISANYANLRWCGTQTWVVRKVP